MRRNEVPLSLYAAASIGGLTAPNLYFIALRSEFLLSAVLPEHSKKSNINRRGPVSAKSLLQARSTARDEPQAKQG